MAILNPKSSTYHIIVLAPHSSENQYYSRICWNWFFAYIFTTETILAFTFDILICLQDSYSSYFFYLMLVFNIGTTIVIAVPTCCHDV